MSDTFRFLDVIQTTQEVRSRYRRHRLIELNGVVSQESWIPPEFPVHENDKVHRVRTSERLRLDLIANEYYGDQNLWWVIAFANDILDPFMELNGVSATPTTLRIPAPEVVNARVIR